MEKLKQKIEKTRDMARTRTAIGAVSLLAALGAAEASPAAAEAPHHFRHSMVEQLEQTAHRNLMRHRGVQIAHGTLMLRKKVHGNRYVTTGYVENPVIADRVPSLPQKGPIDTEDFRSGRYAMGSISRDGRNKVSLHEISADDALVEFMPDLKTVTPDALVQTVDFGHDNDGDLMLNSPFLKTGTGDPLLDPAGSPAVVAMEYSSHK
jgi:hypothetical protein